jgi:hypothetical protein
MQVFGDMKGRKALGVILLVALLSVLVPLGLYLAANLYFGDEGVSSSSANEPAANLNLPGQSGGGAAAARGWRGGEPWRAGRRSESAKDGFAGDR